MSQMSKLRACLMALICGVVGASVIQAQTPSSPSQGSSGQDPTQPTQAQQPAKSADDNSANQDQLPTPPVVAGTSTNAPITGASQPIIGLVASRSYISPSIFFFGQLDSNANNSPSGGYHFASINTLMGSVAVQKLGRASQLNIGYLAGRTFSSQGGALNSTTQEAAVSELWSRGRWDGFILDKFLYSSQSAFLGGATPFDIAGLNTVAGLANTGPVVLRNSFLPGQGIFTVFGPRLSNALVAQVNNHLSRRVFFTMVGNYDVLHFYDSNLINSSAAGFQTGFGYERSRRDTFAFVYRFNNLWYDSMPISIRDNVMEGAYQRQIAERLLFQIGAGPEISFIQDPNLPLGTLPSNTRVSWAVDSLIHYQLRRDTSVNAGYNHFLSSGSGVFLGAITDRVLAGMDRQLSRVWKLDVTLSYARNRNLIPFFSNNAISTPADATFDSVYGGFEMRRQLGRDAELFFGYLGRYQTASFTVCPQGICRGQDLVGHQFNFGFAWHLKPVPIG
jgi:hypothetical protein